MDNLDTTRIPRYIPTQADMALALDPNTGPRYILETDFDAWVAHFSDLLILLNRSELLLYTERNP